MASTLAACTALSILLAGNVCAASTPPTDAAREPEMTITIRVYNYAQVPARIWAEAESGADRIMAKGRVQVVWVECPLRDDARANRACLGALGPTDLVLRLEPRFKPVQPHVTRRTLGFVPRSDGERAAYAVLSYERVLAVAAEKEFSRSVIMACAVAHELGHLLLGSTRHMPAGIMREELGQEELRAASVGHLLFTAEQYERMRAEIRARQGH